MIEVIPDLPDFVAGFHAEGKVTRDDYQAVVLPLIEEKLHYYTHINLLYDLDDSFESYDWQAIWLDGLTGWKHYREWHHIALVTDLFWIQNTLKFWSLCLPRHLKVFYREEFDVAREWVSHG